MNLVYKVCTDTLTQRRGVAKNARSFFLPLRPAVQKRSQHELVLTNNIWKRTLICMIQSAFIRSRPCPIIRGAMTLQPDS